MRKEEYSPNNLPPGGRLFDIGLKLSEEIRPIGWLDTSDNNLKKVFLDHIDWPGMRLTYSYIVLFFSLFVHRFETFIMFPMFLRWGRQTLDMEWNNMPIESSILTQNFTMFSVHTANVVCFYAGLFCIPLYCIICKSIIYGSLSLWIVMAEFFCYSPVCRVLAKETSLYTEKNVGQESMPWIRLWYGPLTSKHNQWTWFCAFFQ